MIMLIVGSLAACAAAPAKPVDLKSTDQLKSKKGMAAAAEMYNARNFSGAFNEFEKIIAKKGSSANNRRLAHLGKALVYLGNDAEFHSIANAKMSLVSAGKVTAKKNQAFGVETDLLMDAVSAVIGSESKYLAIRSKSGNSGAQIAQLKEEIDSLTSERDELITGQEELHEALEKLKQLTLGN